MSDVTVNVTNAGAAGVTVTNGSTVNATVGNGGSVSVATGTISPGNATVVSGTVNVGKVTTLSSGSSATVTNSGTTYNAVIDFGIPAGPASTVSVGSTTTLSAGSNATVTATTSGGNVSLAFGIPAGKDGKDGTTPAITIGTVTTGAAGSSAAVKANTVSGGVSLDFTIPAGATGATGAGGAGSFTLPAATSTSLGGVIVGTGLAISSGVLSATGGTGGIGADDIVDGGTYAGELTGGGSSGSGSTAGLPAAPHTWPGNIEFLFDPMGRVANQLTLQWTLLENGSIGRPLQDGGSAILSYRLEWRIVGSESDGTEWPGLCTINGHWPSPCSGNWNVISVAPNAWSQYGYNGVTGVESLKDSGWVSYTIANIPTGSWVQVRAASVNANGTGPYTSDWGSGTPQYLYQVRGPARAPTNVTAVAGTTNGANSAAVAWSTVEKYASYGYSYDRSNEWIKSYTVRVSDGTNAWVMAVTPQAGSNAQLTLVSGQIVQVESSGATTTLPLQSGATYSVKIRAYTDWNVAAGDNGASSGWSSPVSFVAGSSASDPLWSSVRLLLHGDGNLTDASGHYTVQAFGNAAPTTSQKKFGSGSIAFDGSGDYLYVPSSAGDLSFGTDDFTAEAWVRLAALPYAGKVCIVFDNRSGSASGWYVFVNAGGVAGVSWGGAANLLGGSVTATEWTHVALCRSGNTMRLFVNGTQTASASVSGSQNFNTSDLYIGRLYTSTEYLESNDLEGYWNGQMDEIRFTHAARYTSSFAVPTAAFPTS